MSVPGETDAEEIVCDTSFVSVMQSARVNQALIASWPQEHTERLDNAILGISAVSLAELRFGHILGNWGSKRIASAEAIIAAYLWFPVDLDVVDHWARLRAASKRGGWGAGDNDLWIAATALSRGCAVVSCDVGFCRIEGLDLIYLPGRPNAPQTCP